jgi:hypothetical protein
MIVLASLTLVGCAHQNELAVKQRAYIVGQSTKDVIDSVYGAWDGRARARVEECVQKLPPAEHTVKEYDACVGPYSEKNQELVVSLLEGVRAAQLALYIALSENRTTTEVQLAMAQLVASVTKLRSFIEENR